MNKIKRGKSRVSIKTRIETSGIPQVSGLLTKSKSRVSIKTRIETFKLFIVFCYFSKGKSRVSIKTRIETFYTFQLLVALLLVKVEYPLKQGLKQLF